MTCQWFMRPLRQGVCQMACLPGGNTAYLLNYWGCCPTHAYSVVQTWHQTLVHRSNLSLCAPRPFQRSSLVRGQISVTMYCLGAHQLPETHPSCNAGCQRRVREQAAAGRLLGQVPRRARDRVKVTVRRLVPLVDGLAIAVADHDVQAVMQQTWVLCSTAARYRGGMQLMKGVFSPGVHQFPPKSWHRCSGQPVCCNAFPC